MSIRSEIVSRVPSGLRAGLRRVRRYPGWYMREDGRRSRNVLADLRDRHAGERCVIVGNGPSLNRMDLSVLNGETTFGMNRIYMGLARFGFTPSYYVSVNNLVCEQYSDDIAALPGLKFLSWRNRHRFSGNPDAIYLRSSAPRQPFATDAREEIWEGATVTYVALQLAYHMGFSKVVLIGVDHRFQVEGAPHAEQVATGPDTNHFDANYFAAGTRWNLPDLVTSETAYRQAKAAFEADGRQVVDATVDGALTVFAKEPLSGALSSDGRARRPVSTRLQAEGVG